MSARGERSRSARRGRARAFALALVATVSASTALASGSPEELLLAVRIDRELVADAIPAWAMDGRALLPLGEIAALLEFPVELVGDGGAEITEIRVGTGPEALTVELGRHAVRFGGLSRALDDRRLLVLDGDAFLDAELLAPALGLEIAFRPRAAEIRIQEVRPSPRTRRLERLARQTSLQARGSGPESLAAPRVDAPRRAIALPAGDLSMRLAAGENGTATTDWGALLEGDLLHLDTSLYLSGHDGQPDDLRWTAGRRDPDGRLLGVLGAREALVGDVHLTRSGLAGVPGSGEGFWVSNRRLDLPTGFAEHVFRGSLAPGWQVELYRSGELIGFTSGDGAGQFEIGSVPLRYGLNDFQLVFHGPNGERREENRVLEIGRQQLQAGELEYRAGWVRPEGRAAGALLDLDYGLSNRFTLSGGLVSTEIAEGRRTVAETALTGWLPGVLARVDLAAVDDGELAGRLSLTGRWRRLAVRFEHSELGGFTTGALGAAAPALDRRTRVRIDGTARRLRLAIPYSVELAQETFSKGGVVRELAARTSLVRRRTSLGHRLAWRQSSGGVSVPNEGLGTLQWSRFGTRLSLRGELEYSWVPEVELRSLGVSTELRLPRGRLLVARAARATRDGSGTIDAELRRLEGSWGWGLGFGYRENDGFRATLSINVGVVPPADEEGEWHTDARHVTNSGSIDARLFLDLDDDGVRDPEEPPVESASLLVARSRRSVPSDGQGRVVLGRLPCHQPLRISVDERTLGESLWVAATPELEVVLRPGAPLALEIPIRSLNELAGTISLRRGESVREASGIRLQLTDETGAVRRQTRVAFDGFYEFRSVEPGRYRMRVDPSDAARLGVVEAELREISLPHGGLILDGLDHVVVARALASEGPRRPTPEDRTASLSDPFPPTAPISR